MDRNEMTLGRRIAAFRRARKLRQDDLAEALMVSPQAVSKWENDNSCPDISLLPGLAEILGVTVDELLTGKSAPVTQLLPPEERKNIDDMVMRIIVDSADGDKVRVNLPLGLIRVMLEAGPGAANSLNLGFSGDAIKNIDFAQLLSMADRGLVGDFIDVESAAGDVVHIIVE